MKRLIGLFGCVFLLGLAGCGRQAQSGGRTRKAAFPEVMVGVWEADAGNDNKWGIKFEPDGSIKKIIHPLAGPVDITKGGVDMGSEKGYFIYVMGPCEARYIPETRMIKMKIIVDSFIITTPAGEAELRIEDYFDGSVSEDGKTWRVDWREYCWTKDATPPDFNEIPVRLIFSKQDEARVMKGNEGVQ